MIQGNRLLIEDLITLDIGGVLFDMHDGFPEIVDKENISVISRVQYEMQGGSEFIEKNTKRRYLNKTVVLVGQTSQGHYVFNYSYDDKYFGVIVISLHSDRKEG